MPTNWILVFNILLFLVASIISLDGAFRVWRRRSAPGAVWLVWMLVAVGFWSFTYALEAVASSPADKILLSTFSYLGTYSGPVLALFFVLELARAGWVIQRRRKLLFWIVPLSAVILVFTNSWHGMIWSGFHLLEGAPYPVLIYEPGLLHPLTTGYLYLLMLATTLILIREAFHLRGVYRTQIILLLVAALLPWSANIVYMFDIAISPGIDYTPVGFTVTGLVLSLGIYRYQLLDLIPVAREKVIENLSEAILVLDDMQRVIDYNPAAAPFFKAVPNPAAGGWIGHSAGAALLAWPVLQPHFQSRAAQHAEVRVELNADWRDFTLNVTPLFDPRGRLTGRVAALLDITPHKRAEETAVRALKIAEALQAASAALNSTLEFDRILQVILDRIAQVIALDCALVLLDDADALVISAVSCGTAPDLHLGTRIAVEGSRPENQVARERRPIRLESAAVELPAVVELPVAVELPAAEGLPAAADRGVENAPCVQGALEWPLFPQACSFLGLPVVFQDRVTGVLALYREHPEPFSEDDEQVGMSFASGVAMALENSRLYEQMKHNASTDPLTGAFNRRYFFERLEQEHARCRRFDSGMALVMLDVDFFKKLNDSFGHAFGDRILQAVIRVARSSLRGSDVLARYGGEEFVILLPNTGIEGAALVAERVRKLVEAIPLREIEGYPLERAGDPPHVTISLGISQRNSADASVDELLIRADKALYQAKQTGRNRVCIIT